MWGVGAPRTTGAAPGPYTPRFRSDSFCIGWPRHSPKTFGVRRSAFGVRGSAFEVRGFAVRRFAVRRFAVRRFDVRGSGFGVRGSGFGVPAQGLAFPTTNSARRGLISTEVPVASRV